MTLLVETALQSGAFIPLLALPRPLMKRSLSATARFALWALPALRLMLPLRRPASTACGAGWPAADKPLMAANPVSSAPKPVSSGAACRGCPGGGAAGLLPRAAPSAALPLSPGPDWAALLPSLLVWAWIPGVLIMLGRFLLINYRFYTLTKGRWPLKVRASPAHAGGGGADSPGLFGLFRPRIQLNRASLQSDAMLDMVLSHELAHWQRRDHLWALLRACCCAPGGWNPRLGWRRRSAVDGEAACDEAVTRGMDKQEAEALRMSLITLMKSGKVPGGLWLRAPPMILASAS